MILAVAGCPLIIRFLRSRMSKWLHTLCHVYKLMSVSFCWCHVFCLRKGHHGAPLSYSNFKGLKKKSLFLLPINDVFGRALLHKTESEELIFGRILQSYLECCYHHPACLFVVVSCLSFHSALILCSWVLAHTLFYLWDGAGAYNLFSQIKRHYDHVSGHSRIFIIAQPCAGKFNAFKFVHIWVSRVQSNIKLFYTLCYSWTAVSTLYRENIVVKLDHFKDNREHLLNDSKSTFREK